MVGIACLSASPKARSANYQEHPNLKTSFHGSIISYSIDHKKRTKRQSQGLVVRNEAIPGPLFMSEGGQPDRDFLRGLASAGSFIKFPVRSTSALKRTPPLVRVRLTVAYRVHSRQMLCVGGSAIPFGWSFLSIAKVPMCWEPDDIWAVEVELPAGSKVEYKYVILEEQDWTQQVNANAEGTVDYTYRSHPDTSPPDVQKITRKMAIVAWQSGSNRVLQVPSEKELNGLTRNGPANHREFDCHVGGSGSEWTRWDNGISFNSNSSNTCQELLYIDEENRPTLHRRDVWGEGKSPFR
ncbi:hypothetical protein PSENEW3n2_00001901 [Picochlorum sp. SENEW3]|nr:hypothetical protein PSENEW3n2_00001901 [Picochlorum sp. SENEW3]WPT14671.1 hypothetical protein PSENEW3_00001901 [Picochlorum sp. SENEW3]